MDGGVEEVPAVPELDDLRPSPEQRTNIVLRLLEEVATVGVDENAHDLQLFFLDLENPALADLHRHIPCLLYTSPSPRDPNRSRMPSSA